MIWPWLCLEIVLRWPWLPWLLSTAVQGADTGRARESDMAIMHSHSCWWQARCPQAVAGDRIS